jgi:hypothetical protein
VKPAAVGALLLEARNVMRAIQDERRVATVGPLVVSGMLAEQLARELGAGAAPGSVVVSDGPRVPGAQVAIRIIAGDPSEDDDAFVRESERAEIPVVLVQLWPQKDWGAPFVLSPFVVECKTGEGFPLEKIAGQVATAADEPTALAGRVPVLEESVTRRVLRGAVIRAGLVGATLTRKGPARPVLALEQIGMVSRLRAVEDPETHEQDQLPVVAGTAAATIAASFAFRELARGARRMLPVRLADAAVAAVGTWALAQLARRLEARGLL